MSQEKTGQTAPIETPALLDLLGARAQNGLIGIDGLPVSGKSTLAEKLVDTFGAQVIYLDDFVLPQALWPKPAKPGFPFPYIRHEDFFAAVETLAHTGTSRYQLYDWEAGTLGEWKHVSRAEGMVVVEGVSALSARLAPLYNVRIWMESDAATTLSASLARGVGAWEREWRELFLPSVELYMAEAPCRRADVIMGGRGAQGRYDLLR